MEFVLVIIAIVYSIWSEINKQKQEKNVDFDFSELSSIDDFLKKQNDTDSLEPMPVSQMPSRQDRKNRRHQKKPAQNWHSPDQQSGFIKTDPELSISESGRREQEIAQTMSSESSSGQHADSSFSDQFIRIPEQASSGLKLDRNNLLKAFIMSEVMTRYDINRIYERVPGVRQDEE